MQNCPNPTFANRCKVNIDFNVSQYTCLFIFTVQYDQTTYHTNLKHYTCILDVTQSFLITYLSPHVMVLSMFFFYFGLYYCSFLIILTFKCLPFFRQVHVHIYSRNEEQIKTTMESIKLILFLKQNLFLCSFVKLSDVYDDIGSHTTNKIDKINYLH